MRTTLVLVDDHQMFREAMADLLSRHYGFEVVGQAADGLQAMQLVRELRPDVLLLDLGLPRLHGQEVIRRCRAESLASLIVVVSMHSSRQDVLRALQAGALGYVLKISGCQEVVKAIEAATEGRRHLDPGLKLEPSQVTALLSVEASPDPLGALTDREREVLQMSAEGMTSREIGVALEISHRTVETHLAHLMSKLSLSNRAELVHYAMNAGLLTHKL